MSPLHVQFVLGVKHALPARSRHSWSSRSHKLQDADAGKQRGWPPASAVHQLDVNRWCLEMGGHSEPVSKTTCAGTGAVSRPLTPSSSHVLRTFRGLQPRRRHAALGRARHSWIALVEEGGRIQRGRAAVIPTVVLDLRDIPSPAHQWWPASACRPLSPCGTIAVSRVAPGVNDDLVLLKRMAARDEEGGWRSSTTCHSRLAYSHHPPHRPEPVRGGGSAAGDVRARVVASGDLRPPARLSRRPWLTRIARNRAIDWLRLLPARAGWDADLPPGARSDGGVKTPEPETRETPETVVQDAVTAGTIRGVPGHVARGAARAHRSGLLRGLYPQRALRPVRRASWDDQYLHPDRSDHDAWASGARRMITDELEALVLADAVGAIDADERMDSGARSSRCPSPPEDSLVVEQLYESVLGPRLHGDSCPSPAARARAAAGEPARSPRATCSTPRLDWAKSGPAGGTGQDPCRRSARAGW